MSSINSPFYQNNINEDFDYEDDYLDDFYENQPHTVNHDESDDGANNSGILILFSIIIN